MDELIIKDLAAELFISVKQINTVLELFKSGSTIPFIARYRKEATGALDENQISSIKEKYDYFVNLYNRKETIINLIEEKGLLTDQLKQNIIACKKLVDLEDLYLPYKEKKKTKATEALKMGLESTAKKIMSFPTNGSMESLFATAPVDPKTARDNTCYIISEWISDNAFFRKYIRNYIFNKGYLITNIKKDADDKLKVYEMYYNFNESINNAKSYRVLAINRGEKEKILNVKVEYDFEYIFSYLKTKIIKNPSSYVVLYVEDAIKDALKRLMLPSIEREIRSEITEKSEDEAIEIFKKNLENLLMAKPLAGYNVMGFDPAFRTGCKLACLDKYGNLLHIDTIYPHEPKNDYLNSKKKILELISKYNINLIAIGNGTASRESELFVSSIVSDLKDVHYIIVNEAGASVYSASKEAQKEFPNLEVQERSAISIGRRIQDPLSELVKINPQSIGVGEYQHDVNNKKLTESLDFTVSKAVNEVGVNINTASSFILKYISGLTKPVINKIMTYKEKNIIKSREQLKTITSDKVYEQAIGFLRINDGNQPLDNTGIHPESYELTNNILKYLNLDIKNINSQEFKDTLNKAAVKELINEFNSNEYTIEDIIKELLNPGLDPRTDKPEPILRSDVLKIEDLNIGLELKGTVRNVTNFGAFVDIGLKNDGLLHISKMSDKFVKNPLDILSTGDIITCYVDDIIIDKKKVSLTMLKKS